MLALINSESWQVASAALVLILGVIFKFLLDWKKTKDEREAATERLQVLRDIAQSNQAIRLGQIEQNGKLSTIVTVNNTQHEETIRALNATCKARPIFLPETQTTNKTQHEKTN